MYDVTLFKSIDASFGLRLEHGLKAVMARKLAKLDAQLQRSLAHPGFARNDEGGRSGMDALLTLCTSH